MTEMYYREILVTLAFVALAWCKRRHYSTLDAYLSLEIPIVLHLGCVSAAGIHEGNVWDLHVCLIVKIETALCVCPGRQLET